MRWLLLMALVGCSCGKKAPEVSALERTHAKGGMNAASWTDRNGENRAVFSITDAEQPPAHPDDEMGNGPSYTRRVRVELTAGGKSLQVFTDEASDMFPFEAEHGFIDAALGLTDLDGDGVAELTFAYLLASAAGGPALTMDLVVLEGGDRYVLRGSTLGDLGNGHTEGGDFVADAAMQRSPFFAHAKGVWAKIRQQP